MKRLLTVGLMMCGLFAGSVLADENLPRLSPRPLLAAVVADEPMKIVIALNGHRPEDLKDSGDGQLAVLTIERPKNETVEWRISFK